jgi:hypothetical protein
MRDVKDVTSVVPDPPTVAARVKLTFTLGRSELNLVLRTSPLTHHVAMSSVFVTVGAHHVPA